MAKLYIVVIKGDNMFGYIYKVTNLINNKIYIGQHYKSDNSLTELDKNYWASGIKINNAFSKYGKENFTREILCWCNNLDELNEKEKFYIKYYNTTDTLVGYNLAEGGSFGSSMLGHTEEEKAIWRKNISIKTKEAMNTPEMESYMKEANKKSDEWKKHLSESLTGHKGHPMSDEQKEILRNKNIGNKYGLGNKSRTGMKNSAEMNAKISESCKKVEHTDEWNKKVSESLKGRHLSEDTKEKLRKPKPKYRWLLPDGTIKIMDASNGSRHKDWIKLEKINDDNINN